MDKPKAQFVGRKEELAMLNKLAQKKAANLVAITGRRRIGKSRLIREFAKDKEAYFFTGLPPSETTTAREQRQEFIRQLAEYFQFPKLVGDDWGDLFALLARSLPVSKKTVILLDEISWMGSKDHLFLSKLKVAWDLYFSKQANVTLVLCGSVSSWIEKNILNSTGFFGRVSLKLSLDELSMRESLEFLKNCKGSLYEKLIYLSVVGGVPWYLELFNSKLSVAENIRQLCFYKDGILVDEFERVFNDLFDRRGAIYKKIVRALSKRNMSQNDIATVINYDNSGTLSEYLEDLVKSGFISKDFTWQIQSGIESRHARYRISDNYLSFYFRFIAPNLSRIKKGQLVKIDPCGLANWHSTMGLQFENLILNNRQMIYEALGIRAEQVVIDGPYFQTHNTKQEALQIDYLIQTKFKSLYLCEIKFSTNEISSAVIKETEAKMSKLKLPRGFACLPVLIHASQVTESVSDADYFSGIVDVGEMLQ